mgnify:CR=1 FL=1
MKKLIFIIILITSCARQDLNESNYDKIIDSNKEYSLIEFKKLLDKYNDQKGYPNIDK